VTVPAEGAIKSRLRNVLFSAPLWRGFSLPSRHAPAARQYHASMWSLPKPGEDCGSSVWA